MPLANFSLTQLFHPEKIPVIGYKMSHDLVHTIRVLHKCATYLCYAKIIKWGSPSISYRLLKFPSRIWCRDSNLRLWDP